MQVLCNYARYPAGHDSYIESLTTAPGETEVTTTKPESFYMEFFDERKTPV